MPRGCVDDVRQALTDLGVRSVIRNKRQERRALDVTFRGELCCEQRAAADAMLPQDTSVLAATAAFGKTVVAAWLVAQRGVNTLVLVHRRQLLDQWVERLSALLGLPTKAIGRIGGGRPEQRDSSTSPSTVLIRVGRSAGRYHEAPKGFKGRSVV
jgi:superfamily II DNA or RNA helicase